jgi:hypothetical protein
LAFERTARAAGDAARQGGELGAGGRLHPADRELAGVLHALDQREHDPLCREVEGAFHQHRVSGRHPQAVPAVAAIIACALA